MSSSSRMLLVLGSGPGIRNSVASLCVSQHFTKLFLVARSEERLASSNAVILNAAGIGGQTIQVGTYAADLGDSNDVQNALAAAETFGGDELECVFYNGARVRRAGLFNDSEDEMLYDFKITILGLYSVAAWAIPKLRQLSLQDSTLNPTFIVTTGYLHKDPRPAAFSLSLTKTAQRNLVECLNLEYGQEVHVGLVMVGGQVGPEKENLNPSNIANKTWDFFQQKRGSWQLETQIFP